MLNKREREDREAITRKLKRLLETSQYKAYGIIAKKKTLQQRVTDATLQAAAEIRKISKEEGIALTTAQSADIAGLLVVGWKELISPLEVPDPPS